MKYFLVIVAAVLVTAVIVLLYTSKSPQVVRNYFAANTSPATSMPLVPQRIAPKGFKEFHSPEYHFSIFYPEDLSVRANSQVGGRTTFIFENAKNVRGFQIFVQPYGESTITEEQFKRDAPSGVRKESRHINIDGAAGGSFFSMDENLGETAEAWFLKSGILYEATTLKSLAPMLTEVLDSWQFTE